MEVSRALIFIHIMKAAGTSFNAVLEQQFKADKIYSSYGVDLGEFERTFCQLTAEEQSNIELIRGHMIFGFHSFLPRAATYITLVRNPIDRVVSHYNYIMRRPEHPHHAIFKKEKLGLLEFAKSTWDPIDTASNIQTRYIAGDLLSDPLSSTLLVKAKENLVKYFPVIGIAERFDESILLMQRAFGWKYTRCFYPLLNMRRRNEVNGLDIKVKDAILEKNQLDVQLYELCLGRFAQQVSAAAITHENIARFARWNNVAAPLIRAKIKYIWPNSRQEKWNHGFDWKSV